MLLTYVNSQKHTTSISDFQFQSSTSHHFSLHKKFMAHLS